MKRSASEPGLSVNKTRVTSNLLGLTKMVRDIGSSSPHPGTRPKFEIMDEVRDIGS